VADDIVSRLQEMLDGPVPFVVGREDIREALNEIERLREDAKAWQSAATILSQDISNSKNEIDRLNFRIQELEADNIYLKNEKWRMSKLCDRLYMTAKAKNK